MNDTAPIDELSFFPDGHLARRAQARANRLCGALLIVALAGIGGAFAIAERATDRARVEHAEVTAAFDLQAERLGRLDAMQKQQQVLARRARLAESLVERTPRAEVLTEVRDLLPDEATLLAVNLTSRARPASPKTPEQLLAERQGTHSIADVIEPKVYDVTMRIGGVAFTDVQVAQFISRLGRSRYFDDVNLLYSHELELSGQTLRRFDVELVVRAEPQAHDDAHGDPLIATEALPVR